MRQKVIKITSSIKEQKLESKDKKFQEKKRIVHNKDLYSIINLYSILWIPY